MKPKVLLVDDELSSLALLTSVLAEGVAVLTAATGGEGVKSAKHDQPDLILLDADLPDFSGFEVCRRLKADPDTASIPVIFLTGYDDLLFEIQAFEAGAVDYVVKNVSPIRILMRVRAHIKNGQSLKFGEIAPLVKSYVEKVVNAKQNPTEGA
ncbi:response regulator [Neptuniibacter sp. CAU 1671]|uniref:response regulator n=1 Tax=Neptuniibacter sp. CAU 1671 TaxID=3032593 RepID=UPI0023DA0CDC|nr:response regulator [Neptuniibacter sp. CAU 1671]MDF2181002.1 response regulator [Neptuniibacter sp. CAU 1671]